MTGLRIIHLEYMGGCEPDGKIEKERHQLDNIYGGVMGQ